MIPGSRFIVVFALMLLFGTYLTFHSNAAVPVVRSFGEFPRNHSGWKMAGESFISEDVQRVLKASDYISRLYIGPDGKPVFLYIGYHNGGKESGAIHSPKHCLPGSGWLELGTAETVIDTGGPRINAVKAVYQKGGEKQLFLYWFQVRDKTMGNEVSLKLHEIMNSALYGRKDSTFIRLSVPVESDETAAVARGERFIKDFYPLITSFIPR